MLYSLSSSVLILIGCFQEERVGGDDADEPAEERLDQWAYAEVSVWLSATEKVVKKIDS